MDRAFSAAAQTEEFYTLRRPSGAAARRTAIDLFSGAGGLSLGLANAGYDIRFAADLAPACGETHVRNFPATPFHVGDVAVLSGRGVLKAAGLVRGELDLLAGGPPCQGFSIIGERDRSDPRNDLFGHCLRLADELRPKAVLIENVTGLATMSRGAVLAELGRRFGQVGYTVACAELLAAQYGVPQMRWRMAFVGWRRDQYERYEHTGFPAPTHGRLGIGALVPNRTVHPAEGAEFLTTYEAVGDLPPVAAGGQVSVYAGPPDGVYQRAMRAGLGAELFNHYAPAVSELTLTRIRALAPGQDWRDLPPDLLPAGLRRALRKDHTRRYRRMRWDTTPRTIITKFRDPKSGEYTHPAQHRTISVREAARIQSFPDWFELAGTNSDQYEQVGNAVPPLLGRAVGFAVRAALEGGDPVPRAPRSRYRVGPSQPALFADASNEVVA